MPYKTGQWQLRKRDVVRDRFLVNQTEILEYKGGVPLPEQATTPVAPLARIFASDKNLPSGGPTQEPQHVEQCCLAATISPDERKRCARRGTDALSIEDFLTIARHHD